MYASLEFHLKRGDFEAWFKGLGDEELAKKIGITEKTESRLGEDLRDNSTATHRKAA